MAVNCLSYSMTATEKKKKMEELAKRINRNIAQHFMIKLIVRIRYFLEEVELMPDSEVNDLLA